MAICSLVKIYFLTSDGEKAWRKRDEEFDNKIDNETNVINLWNKGWACLFILH